MTDKKENPSCGYTGKILDADYIVAGQIIRTKGECQIASCVNGKCWMLMTGGYENCPKCSSPDVDPVIKNENTPGPPGGKDGSTAKASQSKQTENKTPGKSGAKGTN